VVACWRGALQAEIVDRLTSHIAGSAVCRAAGPPRHRRLPARAGTVAVPGTAAARRRGAVDPPQAEDLAEAAKGLGRQAGLAQVIAPAQHPDCIGYMTVRQLSTAGLAQGMCAELCVEKGKAAKAKGGKKVPQAGLHTHTRLACTPCGQRIAASAAPGRALIEPPVGRGRARSRRRKR
jgi:hypothetical protein